MEQQKPENDLPPFVKSWKQFYRLLVGWLLLLILLFFIFTVCFR